MSAAAPQNRLRWIQWAGLTVLGLSAFWPVFHFRAYPIQGRSMSATEVVYSTHDAATAGVGLYVLGNREVPVQELGTALVESSRGASHVRPFWERRRWYPYFLLPLWILALLAAGLGARMRRLAGAGLWLLALGLALFEALYLQTEYAPFLPGGAGQVEVVLVWLLVVTILFYRRRADRWIGAVEATIASQALLAFVHALTLPSTMARGWLGAFDTRAVLETVWHNFPPAFWIGCAGMLLISLPVYLRRPAGAAP